MRAFLQAVAAFITCFGLGAALHFFLGFHPRTWFVPTMITGLIVATFAYCAAA
jgi:hypothetical protein